MSRTGDDGTRPDSQWCPTHRQIVSPGKELTNASLIEVYVRGPRTKIPDSTWFLAPDSTESTLRWKELSDAASYHLEHTPSDAKIH